MRESDASFGGITCIPLILTLATAEGRVSLSDQELADRIVALGVGTRHEGDDGRFSFLVYQRQPDIEGYYSAYAFVTDWRVAGALLEKAKGIWCANHFDDWRKPDTGYFTALVNKSLARSDCLPRAIIEACVEALYK